MMNEININDLCAYLQENDVRTVLKVTSGEEPLVVLMNYVLYEGNQECGSHKPMDDISDQEIDVMDLPDFLENQTCTGTITIQRDGAPLAVMVSSQDFTNWRRARAAEAAIYTISDEEFEEMMNAPIPEECYLYDHEHETKTEAKTNSELD